ncbi:M42 family metallopeptidase [Bacillaceae bacterium SIJ1]|uniref:M42 family metallopeptidase n=1 Tax=Litoribacterium kuwaitense TaxID=1398745 RepID=UPI0013ED196B|nr:M42 family metallopeptidase [Litoribacterium kuwaitense]NGP44210.1 M42 family metallopeptidase [Litoribacterium kuwaitense]
MQRETKEMFRTLTELRGAPGFEHDVRAYMKKELEPLSDRLIQDRLGSVFGVKEGPKGSPKVMVAGHMDEVGFMVTGVTKTGMVRFQPLGGWWSQVLLAQRVQIVTDNHVIPGVISSIPPHLLDESTRNKPVDIKQMLIDVGADHADHAKELGIRPGQQIIPICPFTEMADDKKIMAKAWDNRYGCGLALELLKNVKDDVLPNTLYSGATVQEEVGLRGAKTAANLIEPDVFFALDASPANDMTGSQKEFGHLGKGALLRIFDRSMITHQGMKDFVLDTAETNDIPYQYFVSPGGTDAGSVHLSGSGVPSAVIGICSRYIHTSASIIHTDDYEAAKALLTALVKATDQSVVDTLRAT